LVRNGRISGLTAHRIAAVLSDESERTKVLLHGILGSWGRKLLRSYSSAAAEPPSARRDARLAEILELMAMRQIYP
jgi:hypothetical protein